MTSPLHFWFTLIAVVLLLPAAVLRMPQAWESVMVAIATGLVTSRFIRELQERFRERRQDRQEIERYKAWRRKFGNY